ncbi:MAG: Eco57I restriction-modification methylase domain-containing protein [Bryobacterales bacterium]|nr:Eco57I restriction-modification methylase domain-containing protein [Bryobacterales bacterium]
MPTAIEDLRPHLQDFDFEGLFIEQLGWNHFQSRPLRVEVDETVYQLQPIAEKAGFAAYVCEPDEDGAVPPYHAQQKIEHRVAKTAFEHLIVFVDVEQSKQVWQWVKREPGKSPKPKRLEYVKGQRGDSLLQPLQNLAFDLDDEAKGIEISDVTDRARRAFDVEKVTKRFYERFRTELTAFQGFIEGITDMGDRDWYASLMLNRMMFVYFIQKQGFLDGDVDYLRHRLDQLRATGTHGKFQDFYRAFLLRLFHEGLGQPPDQRELELDELLGRVPFLNGGLFDVHDLEQDYPDIEIPDEAFERVFEFFDGYRWHLDERPNREDNEINPDVLGYIFEKYINQKQMGAYYTKEDITGYISRNTVIPFLFTEAKKKCPVAFEPDGGVWGLLRDDPDRYIYPAVAHGLTWDARNPHVPKQIDAPRDLPDEIAAGIDDVSRRDGWNAPAPEDVALPTETWREVVARRQRHGEVRSKLSAGEVTEIDDLITLNLDIERFAIDAIAQSEGPELIRAFWQALYGKPDRSETGISVLDPTCGSGAFLFAALNVLEPLYTACLVGMQGFVDDEERTERPRNPNRLSPFPEVLAQVAMHPSERYFILKSIVLNNLYGVDIMDEAVEICKLRLFLKLVAQLQSYDEIEPLPDIDFNIRAGNTLVGFTSIDDVGQAMRAVGVSGREDAQQGRMLSPEQEAELWEIEEQADIANRVFRHFREQQTRLGGQVTATDKAELRDWLQDLDNRLDRLLSSDYGIDPGVPDAYSRWRDQHQPFHWFVEFYGIMSTGGFDAVIGNPPYVATKNLKYSLGLHASVRYPDIYAHILERSLEMTSKRGRCGMILPLSLTFSRDFSRLREVVRQWGTSWLSSFDNIPAALFAGVSQRCTILLGSRGGHDALTTRLYRWRALTRPLLMANVSFVPMLPDFDAGPRGFPRLHSSQGARLLQMHIQTSLKSSAISVEQGDEQHSALGFSPTARNFISTYLAPPPTLDLDGTVASDKRTGSMVTLPYPGIARAALAATSGVTCFWYWLTRGDGFHVTNTILTDFLAPLPHFSREQKHYLNVVGELIHRGRNSALVFKKNAGKYVGNYNYQSLPSLTLRGDLLFLAGIGGTWDDIEELLRFCSLVRAINEHAGEKNIPPSIRAKFSIEESAPTVQETILRDVDAWLTATYDVPSERITDTARVLGAPSHAASPS